MTPFIAEIVGTAVLITLGAGVVANIVLKGTHGAGAGLIEITLAWGLAVFVGVYISAESSGAHLNPAVTIALAVAGKFNWSDVPTYLAAQLIGACIGSFLNWITYKKQYDATENPGAILGSFATGPVINDPIWNFVTEAVATFIFMLSIFFIKKGDHALGSLDALPVALLVVVVGLSMGGPTGYAINPARDLGPRIMHAILPIPHKGHSHWRYAPIPVIAPLVGAILAACVFINL